MAEIHSQGWCCTDCIHLFANGTTPHEWDEEQTEKWLAEIDRRSEGLDVTVGGEHEDDCPNIDEGGDWIGQSDCSCEDREFSREQCATCGTNKHGRRHAITFFAKENA